MEEKVTITKAANGLPRDLVLEQIAEQPQPEPELQAQESIEPQEEQQVEQTPEPVRETHSQKNFKALKAEAARLARERDEAQALIRQYELEKQRRQIQVDQQPQQSYDDFSIDNDAIVEGKHLKAYHQQLKTIKQDLERSRQEAKAMAIRAQLLAERPDYERVVNAENLRALELLKPHLAKAIDLNDPYNAGIACYDLIKEFGIDAEETERNKTEITKALIKENISKPKSALAVQGTKAPTQSPMGRASEFYEGPLTDEMKKIFYKELRDAMNGGSR